MLQNVLSNGAIWMISILVRAFWLFSEGCLRETGDLGMGQVKLQEIKLYRTTHTHTPWVHVKTGENRIKNVVYVTPSYQCQFPHFHIMLVIWDVTIGGRWVNGLGVSTLFMRLLIISSK